MRKGILKRGFARARKDRMLQQDFSTRYRSAKSKISLERAVRWKNFHNRLLAAAYRNASEKSLCPGV